MQDPEPSLSSYGRMSPDSSSYETTKHIRVKLLDEDQLWTQFSQLGTEMIVTRPGRQMFPSVKLFLENLSPFVYYKIYLEMVPVDNARYRYEKGQWVPKQPDTSVRSSWLQHPLSPAEGFKWMLKPVDFPVRLTNCPERVDECTLLLRSMQKYMIVIHIEEGSNISHRNPVFSKAFPFPETTFFAVTTYQNPLVRELKIEKNVHARGARQKKLKLGDCCDENVNKEFSDTFKRPRMDPECLASPLTPENRSASYQTKRASIAPIPAAPTFSEGAPHRMPVEFIKRGAPYFPQAFKYHNIIPSYGRAFPMPYAPSCYSPSCLDCEQSRHFNGLYPVRPQSFPFLQPPSFIPASWPLYQNRILPAVLSGTSTTSGQRLPRVCPSCREGLNVCLACNGSSPPPASDSSVPSSTTDAERPTTSFERTEVSSVSPKTDQLTSDGNAQIENALTPHIKEDSPFSSIRDFSASIREAIQASEVLDRSESVF